MKTIQITIDEPLLLRLDLAVAREKVARSAFIRDAVEEALLDAEEAELDRRDREAYTLQPQTPEETEWATGESVWEDL